MAFHCRKPPLFYLFSLRSESGFNKIFISCKMGKELAHCRSVEIECKGFYFPVFFNKTISTLPTSIFPQAEQLKTEIN